MISWQILKTNPMRGVWTFLAATGLLLSFSIGVVRGNQADPKTRTIEIPFTSHDGYEMFGKLTLPITAAPHAVVVHVQTAEAATVDTKRPGLRGGTFNFLDLYREKLAEVNVAFFSYEGRGVRMGEQPPLYERIDWDIFNTSTLENKVRDILTAVHIVQKQPGVDASQIFLMGTSEGTLLAAEAASRAPKEIKGLILTALVSTTMRDVFKFTITDGAFLVYLGLFDMDKDGKVSKKEFEADPRKFRETSLKNISFEFFDRDGDGFFTIDEMRMRGKSVADAADAGNADVLNGWLKVAATVKIPKDWVKDHLAHPPMWTFLSRLEMPIGIFHGNVDIWTSVEGVRKLEEQANKAGKSNLKFHYFEGVGHSLGIEGYFATGVLPAGYKSIFAYIDSQVRKK
jgi:uncharacterized protein